jgi:ribonuclease P protein component
MSIHTLNKSERLKGHTDIRALFDKGEKIKVFPLTVFYLLEIRKDSVNTTSPLKMGVAVGTRNFKRAVDRNLLKRRVREAYRLQNEELKQRLLASPFDLNLFFVYGDNQINEYATISSAVKKMLDKLHDLLAQKMKDS